MLLCARPPLCLVVFSLLVHNFNLIDIKKYEDRTGNNILDFFKNLRFCDLIDLVKLGNGGCDDDTACKLIDNYFDTGASLVDAYMEIKSCLIGVGANENADDSSTLYISNYKSLTDLYIYFCMQMLSVGLSYSEFWSMNTKEMYKVFDSLNIKLCNDTNRSLQDSYNLAALVGSAVWGKLPKQVPHVDPPDPNAADLDDDADTMDAFNKL